MSAYIYINISDIQTDPSTQSSLFPTDFRSGTYSHIYTRICKLHFRHSHIYYGNGKYKDKQGPHFMH